MIKEAKLLTGLSAKTIRFYESEGLICVKRNSNTYRKYDGKNIDELRRIKILRKLDVPISKIKELNNGKTSLHDIFQAELKKSIIEVILKELNKNPNVNLIEYYKEFEYIYSD
ncbi:MerR family transcriptional regulator [Clostridium tetani]|uniref:MerR family transcriptional regulator n=1 Tax=Clostridium tetani TaxID=1513 RepID=UPI00295296EB|nr:MerR family transcriptional regulator [Clostridium tetani]